MSLNDSLATALSKIMNAEKISQKECLIKPVSKTIKQILTMMNEGGYIGKFDLIEDGKGGKLKVYLLGNINKCGVIKPRFSTKIKDLEKWEKRYLPAKDFGIIFMATPKGYMTHLEAKKKGTGGRLIAYCY